MSEIFEVNKSKHGKDNNLEKEGIKLFREKRFKEALEIFRSLYKSDPKSTEYNYYVGLTLLNLGHYEASLNHLLHTARNSNQYFHKIHSNILVGYIYTLMNEYKLAENHFREVLKINPQSITAYLAISYVFQKTGRYDQSIIYLKKAIEIDPENPRVLNALAYVYAEIGINLNEAARMARKAASMEPDSAEIRDTLAWIYYKKGEIIQAYNEIKKAMELLPNNPEILEHYKEITSKLNT